MKVTDQDVAWPEAVDSEEQLDVLLRRPTPQLVDFMRRLDGDILLLGVSGKMGVSLATLALDAVRQAGVRKRVFGAARFSEPSARDRLTAAGVRTLTCDLLNRASVAALPRVPNVVYLAGRKFGTVGDEENTWATNVLAPALAMEHFAGCRVAAFSTGCVYPLVAAGAAGSVEDDRPGPVGEYAQSCLGRERVFSYCSRRDMTPLCLLRLNYAIDLRYGVLHDIAARVWRGEPVDLTVAWFNVIWQGDANAAALLALGQAACPPAVLNLTGPETLRTRDVAIEFGSLMNRTVSFGGQEGDRCYLNNATRIHTLFGTPRVSAVQLIRWQAHWVMNGGRSLGKPTHFEVADGKY